MDGSHSRGPNVRSPLFLAAPVAVTALLAGCSGTGSARPAASPSAAGGTAPAALSVTSTLQQDYERVVRDVLPSVVQITTGSALGSGIVYDAKGDIVTNAHVVGNARRFKVTLATGGSALNATSVGSFPAGDLAVIRLDHPPGDLRPAKFGDTSKVQVGQITLAMGNPLGLSSSVTEGIVSAVDRTVDEGASDNGTQGATIANMVQTSASINPGNSGGALVNLSGQVIGIPTLAATDPGLDGNAAPGIGFAIPVSTVTRIAGQIVRSGRVTDSGRAALGVTVRTVLADDSQPAGASVVSVKHGGPADKAGVKPEDIVTALGGTRITTAGSLSDALTTFKPGDRTTVTYHRGGDTKKATVTLGQL